MAPAYEYFLINDPQINQVIIDRQHASLEEGPNVSLGRMSQDHELSSGRLNMLHTNRTRNLIPRPVKEWAASEITSRRVAHFHDGTQRGKLEEGLDFRPKRKRERSASDYVGEEMDSYPGSHNGETTDESNVASNDLQVDSDSEDNPGADERMSVSLKMVNDETADERSDSSIEANYSPVYPPGDIDILYSDALLVYVKDFNHFINR